MKERPRDSSPRSELRADGASSGAKDGARGLYLQTPSLKESPEARGLSQTMRDPARRKRNASQKTKDRCNVPAQAGLPDRQASVNGQGGDSSSLTESPNKAKTNGKVNGSDKSERESAASDDATGTTPAGDVAPSSAAACKGRDACAEVAAPRSRSKAARGEKSGTVDDRRPRASGDSKKKQKTAASPKVEPARKEYPPGIDEPLAFDAPGFVDEMHARVNLYEIYRDLLTSTDLKVKQRATEFLFEMKYGKGAPVSAEEAPRVDFGDLPRPQR